MDPFVEQLKHLCAAHPTRSKWVFVPTHALGRTLGDRLVLEGTNWANLRFVTPLTSRCAWRPFALTSSRPPRSRRPRNTRSCFRLSSDRGS